MRPTVVVAVPVLRRPHRVLPLIESLVESVREVPCELCFVCSPNDDAEQEALELSALRVSRILMADWEPGHADWARKINLVYRMTLDPWIFTGADDLLFHPGWADRALEVAGRTGAGVVGTNDLSNSRVIAGNHATHSLVSRRYADEMGTVEGPGAIVAEAYAHNFVDDELVGTARSRGEFAFAGNSHVEHLHPNFAKGERDAVYDYGEKGFEDDRKVFHSRRSLWGG